MKLQEMREKTVEELKNAVVDFKKQLLDLRVQKATNKLEKQTVLQVRGLHLKSKCHH